MYIGITIVGIIDATTNPSNKNQRLDAKNVSRCNNNL